MYHYLVRCYPSIKYGAMVITTIISAMVDQGTWMYIYITIATTTDYSISIINAVMIIVDACTANITWGIAVTITIINLAVPLLLP